LYSLVLPLHLILQNLPPNIDATVEARLKEEKASEPTVQTQPTTTPVPPPTLTPLTVTYTFQSLNDIGFTSYKDNVRDDDFVLQLSKGNFDISQIKKRLSDDDYDNVWFGEITIHKAGLLKQMTWTK
jgi:hypothetical protein